MEIRKFDPQSDYLKVSAWWEKQGWPSIPLEMLPKTGFIMEDAEGGLCAGWLYKTDSKFAWLEWIVANPARPFELRGRALDVLMLRLVETARSSGFKAVFSSINNERLINRYKKHGFKETEKSMTNMIMRIN